MQGQPGLLFQTGGSRCSVKLKTKDIFLVQAYYQFESFGTKPGQVVPADQTYFSYGNGVYTLYLRRGLYILIFRDMQYKTLIYPAPGS